MDRQLSDFGYILLPNQDKELIDVNGHIFKDINLSINTKGHYVVEVSIDGVRRRRFIRPNMELYTFLRNNIFSEISAEEKNKILTELFLRQ